MKKSRPELSRSEWGNKVLKRLAVDAEERVTAPRQPLTVDSILGKGDDDAGVVKSSKKRDREEKSKKKKEKKSRKEKKAEKKARRKKHLVDE